MCCTILFSKNTEVIFALYYITVLFLHFEPTFFNFLENFNFSVVQCLLRNTEIHCSFSFAFMMQIGKENYIQRFPLTIRKVFYYLM